MTGNLFTHPIHNTYLFSSSLPFHTTSHGHKESSPNDSAGAGIDL
jgi:hypothetical protein